MTLLIIAFVSGILTVLAPCILPVLPIVLGATVLSPSRWTPSIVIGALSVSIIVFTILLKVSALFIIIPPSLWMVLSGSIVAFFGLVLLFPDIWSRITIVRGLSSGMNRFMGRKYGEHTFVGTVLVGASLGPIFATCSPTYFLILGTILPVSLPLAIVYIGVYTFGLAIVLLLIAYGGQRYLRPLLMLASPNGAFKRILGVLFITLGVGIAFGFVFEFEVWLLAHMPFDVTLIEHMLLTRFIYE